MAIHHAADPLTVRYQIDNPGNGKDHLEFPGKGHGHLGDLVHRVDGIHPLCARPGSFSRQREDLRGIAPNHLDRNFFDEPLGRIGAQGGSPGTHRIKNYGNVQRIGSLSRP